ncbi:alpha/beta hydrolase [Cohnella fermenti]|uniref:Alpha/beta hydrolase n=1 Tax=Cohnella fermenti TaxID=2565925 RepID=A0A4S4BF39_9BACL|nr:alpha/beta hydrolase [Cohnella fermenti]
MPSIIETVVLVSAAASDWAPLEKRFPLLADRYRILSADVAPPPAAPPPASLLNSRFDRLAAFLAAVQTEGTRTDRVHLAGCGAGADIALRYALSFPAQIASLVLVAWEPVGPAEEGESGKSGEFGLPLLRLGDLRCPVLMLIGGADPTMTTGRYGLPLSFIPDCSLFTVPGAGRHVLNDRPRLVARLLLDFYKTLRNRPARPSACPSVGQRGRHRRLASARQERA